MINIREILFRGKRIDNGKWIEGCYTFSKKASRHIIWVQSESNAEFWHTYPIAVDPLTIGQFTGLTDKNGKKIFEGDRINRKDKQATVVFDDSEFSLAIDGNEFVQHGLLVDVWKNDLEVIGTIHDKQNGGD